MVGIAAGDGHNLALTGGGRVFSGGAGGEGQLGQGHTMHLLSPRLVGDLDFAGIHSTYDGQGRLLLRADGGQQEGGQEGGDGDANNANNGNGDNGDNGRGNKTALPPDGGGGAPTPPVKANGTSGEKGVEDPSQAAKATAPQRAAGKTAIEDGVSSSSVPLPAYLSRSRKAVDALRARAGLPPPSDRGRPPKIVGVHAAGSYSVALSSSGDLYTWGYGDACQLGHPVPPRPPPSSSSSSTRSPSSSAADTVTVGSPRLPYVEPGPVSRTGAGHRIRDSISFDSRLNVLLPRRVECVRSLGLRVEQVAAGPSHMALLCSERRDADTGQDPQRGGEEVVGRTLYEVELGRRSKGLSRLRQIRAASGKQAVGGGGDGEQENPSTGSRQVEKNQGIVSTAEGGGVEEKSAAAEGGGGDGPKKEGETSESASPEGPSQSPVSGIDVSANGADEAEAAPVLLSPSEPSRPNPAGDAKAADARAAAGEASAAMKADGSKARTEGTTASQGKDPNPAPDMPPPAAERRRPSSLRWLHKIRALKKYQRREGGEGARRDFAPRSTGEGASSEAGNAGAVGASHQGSKRGKTRKVLNAAFGVS